MTNKIIFRLVAFLTAGSGASLAIAAYGFRSLGFLPSASASFAYAVSGDGQVVAGSSGSFAMRWTSSSGMTSLGTLPGDFGSVANALSYDGSAVAGTSYTGTGSQAFRWTQATGLTGLGSLSQPSRSVGEAISADGNLVLGDDDHRAFRWTQASGITLYGTPPSSTPVFYVDAATSDGSAIVGKTLDQNAFYWPQSGALSLIPIPGGNSSEAWDITPDGSIVVGQSDGPTGAFRWTPTGGVVSLGTAGQARGVSSLGSVIVGSTQNGTAFIWTRATGVVDLKTFLVQHGVTGLANRTLTAAEDVSYDGSSIVGEGINPSGLIEAWVANIDTPDREFPPTSFSMFRGIVLNGAVGQLINSDNQYLVVRPGLVLSSAEAPIQVIVNGTSPITSPGAFQLKLESSANALALRTYVDFYNYSTNSFEQVRTAPVTLSDSTLFVNAPPNASNYVNPSTGAVQCRLRWKAIGPIIGYPWTVRIDQVRWTVAP